MTRPRRQISSRLAKRHRAASPRRVALRGIVVLSLLGVAAFIALRAYNGVPLRDYRTVYAEVPDVGNMRVHDQVRVAGQRIGQVEQLANTANGTARVKLQIEPSTAALPVDTQVRIRAAGLLGARYIELVPGDDRVALADGATIRGGARAKTFGLPEALNTFDAATRARLDDYARELGTGLEENGAPLNDAIKRGTRAQDPFQAIMSSLLDRPGAVEGFIPSTNLAFSAFDDAREELSRSWRPTADALRPFVDRRTSVRATLAAAPASLQAAQSGLQRGRQLLDATASLARSVNAVLPSAPSGLRAASRLLVEGPAKLPATNRLLTGLEQTVDPTLATTKSLDPVLPQLRRAFDDVIPLNKEVGEHACDIEHYGAVFRSMLGLVSHGPDGREQGQFRFTLVPTPDAVNNKANEDPVTFDPYPEPCKFTGPRSTVDPLKGPQR